MKKLLLSLIVMVFAAQLSAQSLSFKYEGEAIEAGTTIDIVSDINQSMEIQFDLDIINTTNADINVVAQMEDLTGIGTTYLCWGNCFMPGILEAKNIVVAGGEGIFNGHVMFVDAELNTLPEGTEIKMVYTFFDERNPEEKYSFNVNFKYDPEASEEAPSADNFEVDGIYYNIISATDFTVEVHEVPYGSEDYTGDIVIPSTVNYDGSEYSVAMIANYAFSGCTSLTSIEIPNSIIEIGYSAFENCSNLTGIEIPNSVIEIGYSAFKNCTNLTSVTFEENSQLTIIDGDYLSSGAFSGCTSLISIEIPNSVVEIGTATFYNCTSLSSIEIPNSVNKIGFSAFYNCTSLTSIEIPNSVITIGDIAFKNCTNLTSVTFEENSQLTTIDGCFEGCTSLTNIKIPNSITSIEHGNDPFTNLDWTGTFKNCTSLTSVTFEENSQLTIIEYGFVGCTNLTNIEIPNSVTEIGYDAFRDCTSLTNIEIPNSVTEIGYGAFRDCTSLTSIEIPNSVITIGDIAFKNCTSLTSVTFEENSQLTYIWGSFEGCTSLTSIEIPNSVIEIGGESFKNCTNLTSVTFEENSQLTTIDGCFEGCTSLTSIEIPNSVIEIGSSTFYNCTDLTSVTIPNSVTCIEKSTFYGCSSMSSVTIGYSVESIEESAFSGCSSLKDIYMAGIPPKVGENNFTYAQYMNTILYVPKGVLSKYQSAEVWENFMNIKEYDSTGIEDVDENNIAIEVTSNGISLSDSEDKPIAIYSINGILVKRIDKYTGEEITLDKGVYIVSVGNSAMKIML